MTRINARGILSLRVLWFHNKKTSKQKNCCDMLRRKAKKVIIIQTYRFGSEKNRNEEAKSNKLMASSQRTKKT